MDDSAVAAIARSLLDAADTATAHPRPEINHTPLELHEGAAIQAEQLRQRLARGERVIGVKLGLTTVKQREAAEHYRPSVGFLTDAMVLTGPLSASQSIRARVEPEIVAVLGQELSGPDTTDAQIRSAVASFHAGIEIVDPRYVDPAFVLADALADNSSARAVVWNPKGIPAHSVTLPEESVGFRVGVAPELTGRADSLMGDAWIVIVEVITDLLQQGWTLPEGFVIFTGNLVGTAAEVAAGERVRAQFSSLGEVSLLVVD